MICDNYSEWGALFRIRHLQRCVIIQSMIHDDIEKKPLPVFQALTDRMLLSHDRKFFAHPDRKQTEGILHIKSPPSPNNSPAKYSETFFRSGMGPLHNGIELSRYIPTKGDVFLGGWAIYIGDHQDKMTGWWFEPLWKILVNWDDYSQYMGK